LAQKQGVPADESVLFVDASLPGPRRTRPVLMLAGALLGLVILIAFINPGPPPDSARSGRAGQLAATDPGSDLKKDPQATAVPATVPDAPDKKTAAAVETKEEFFRPQNASELFD